MRASRWSALLIVALTGCAGGTSNSDGFPPTLAITAPMAGANVSGEVAISALAADGDSGVDKVRFYIDGTLLVEQYTAPFTVIWNTGPLANNSVHTIRVEAVDLAKNVASQQISVTVIKGPS